MINHLTSITKSDGTRQLFEEGKLVNSLERAGASEATIDEIVDQVESEMWDDIKTEDIYHRAFELLKKHSRHAAVKYSIRRALFDLGPDGFPFERFVTRVFNAWGYEAVTDQTLPGACVEHEMDVVAWKDGDLAMAEAKFHNEFGLKSDLKVALYVKARFDDLADNTFDYGGTRRKLTGRWLFTNTKFTEAAIRYGECKDLKMIGWNYPRGGSLHELVEQYKLHPVTTLSSLSHQQKKDLIGRKALLCSDLVKDHSTLLSIGLNEEAAKRVVEEAMAVADLAK